ncbi:MAG: hypothetical protein E6K18_00755 [Methanobacteriota archaeon]|nr:MAG: hypothetical protein E6K18_00755 [Euryarchaeota archaeon]
MRTTAMLAATMAVALLALLAGGFVAPSARADTIPPPKLFVTLEQGPGGTSVFLPTTITIGQIPTVVNVTVKNVDPTAGMQHTFTIRSTAATPPTPYIVNTGLLNSGEQAQVEFTVMAPDRLVVGTRNETVELDGGLIKFFCIPHESSGMKGHVVLASATTSTETPQMGVFLRAYWIGLLGIAGTMLLVAISYFVIKGSSRHYRDHREHIRRGGP